VTLKIPAATDSGKTFRIKGKGVPTKKGGRGDLLATVQVHVPDDLSEDGQALLDDLSAFDPENVRSHLGV
jgi:molecular chaperone DnaJ